MNEIKKSSGMEMEYSKNFSKKSFETLYVAIIVIIIVIFGFYLINEKKESEKNAQAARAIIEKYKLDKTKTHTSTDVSVNSSTQKAATPKQEYTKTETKKTEIKPVLQDVNLRFDTTSSSEKIHIIYEGDNVEILESKVNSAGYLWYKVKHNNQIGWISYVGFEEKEKEDSYNYSHLQGNVNYDSDLTKIKYGGNENLNSYGIESFVGEMSSFVKQVWYRAEDQTMFVQLKDNYYQYCNVSSWDYTNFKNSFSKGSHYNLHFKGNSAYFCGNNAQSEIFDCFSRMWDNGEIRKMCYSEDKNLMIATYRDSGLNSELQVKFYCGTIYSWEVERLYDIYSSSSFDMDIRMKYECNNFNENVANRLADVLKNMSGNMWCKQGKDYSRPFFGCYNPDNEILIDVYNNETKKYCNVSEYSWDSYRKYHTTPSLTCN